MIAGALEFQSVSWEGRALHKLKSKRECNYTYKLGP